MLHRPIVRTVQLGVCLVALVVAAQSVEAKAKKKTSKRKGKAPSACVVSYKQGIALVQEQRLIEARKAMVMCSQPTCGVALRKECKIRFAQLKEEIPSVIPSATDEKGAPMTDVEVSMDGALLTAEVDGRAVEVNPGVHEFSFSNAKGIIGKQKIDIPVRQRNRPISVSLAGGAGEKSAAVAAAPAPTTAAPPVVSQAALEASSPEAPADRAEQAASSDDPPGMLRAKATDTEPKAKGRGFAPYFFGVVGLAGLGGYGLLTYWGRKDNDALGECSPDCPTENIDHIRKLYLGADVSLGIGVVALATSTWLFLRSSGSSSHEGVAQKPAVPKRPAIVVDVKPAPSGAFATVSGAF
jgi:hypothetical protein